MKRALLKQMRHEWRDNIWMVLGLAIVAIAVWFMTTQLIDDVKGLFYPLGADTENVCKLDIRDVPQGNPGYIDRGEDGGDYAGHDLRMLISGIRHSPYVEAAAFSRNALPYHIGLSKNKLMLDENDSIGYRANLRYMSPDMVRVLKIKSLTGKSAEELEQLLRDGEYLISNYVYPSHYIPRKDLFGQREPEEFYGRAGFLYGGGTVRIGDIVQYICESDYWNDNYWGAPWGMVIEPIDESGNFDCDEMAVRVRPGMKDEFVEEFRTNPSLRRYGNKELCGLIFLDDKAKIMQKTEDTNLRMTLSLNLMLIAIVALGIMGVFWFRVQQRLSETAIRKVCGATDGDIFRRIISEGFILLGMAALIMIAVGWPLMDATLLTKTNISKQIAIIAGAGTLIFLAAAMVICIWLPARKAMAIEPAIAIKDE